MTEETTTQSDLLIGKVLSGQFEILDSLGSGGMGTVYRARDISLGTTVAIKMIKPALAAEPSKLKRLLTEAKALAVLNHPGIPKVLSTKELDGSIYLVMEYVDGRSLAEIIQEQGRLERNRAKKIFLQVASALEHAHAAGIIHRDLKPANLLIVNAGKDDEAAKFVDFGIAKVLTESQNTTQPGALIGTPEYMSPEQCRGETLDARSDIYSLGCVMYETLTGQVPFAGDSPLSVLYQQIGEPLPVIAEKELSTLSNIIQIATSKNKEDRFQDINEMADAIAEERSIRAPQNPARKTNPLSSKMALTLMAAGLVAAATVWLTTGLINQHQHVSKAGEGYETSETNEILRTFAERLRTHPLEPLTRQDFENLRRAAEGARNVQEQARVEELQGIFLIRHQTPVAVEHLKNAIKLADQSEAAQVFAGAMALANEYVRKNQVDNAISVLEHQIKQKQFGKTKNDVLYSMVKLELAGIYEANSYHKSALDLYKQISPISRELKARIASCQAGIDLEKGRDFKVFNDINKFRQSPQAAEISPPAQAQLNLKMAQALIAMKKYKLAEQELDRASKTFSTMPVASDFVRYSEQYELRRICRAQRAALDSLLHSAK